MKTRTLLFLAIACGLAILMAGSIRLLLLTQDNPAPPLAIGDTGKAGDMTVTVRAPVRTSGSQLLIEVQLQGVDDANGALSFEFRNGHEALGPVAPATGAGAACGATLAAEPTRCVLAFETTDSRGVLLYERTDDDVLRWDIGGAQTGATVATADISPSTG